MVYVFMNYASDCYEIHYDDGSTKFITRGELEDVVRAPLAVQPTYTNTIAEDISTASMDELAMQVISESAPRRTAIAEGDFVPPDFPNPWIHKVWVSGSSTFNVPPLDVSSARVLTYAKKGEEIVCENGHVICEVAKDLRTGECHQPGNLRRWRDPEPGPGTQDQPCCKCGAKWFEGMRFHFKDGWR